MFTGVLDVFHLTIANRQLSVQMTHGNWENLETPSGKEMLRRDSSMSNRRWGFFCFLRNEINFLDFGLLFMLSNDDFSKPSPSPPKKQI